MWRALPWHLRIFAVGSYLLVGTLVWLFWPEPLRWIASGFMIATVFWLNTWLAGLSGHTIDQKFGGSFERDTARILRRLRFRGWHWIDDVMLGGRGNVDHIAISPSGPFVIETKYSRREWTLERVAPEVEVMLARAKSVRLFLRHLAGVDVDTVTPVIVLWGSGSQACAEVARSIDGVHVVAGVDLRSFLLERAPMTSAIDRREMRSMMGALRRYTMAADRAEHTRPSWDSVRTVMR